MDLANMTFVGLMTLGFVNVLTFYLPNMDSKVKFSVSVLFAFGLGFVPVEIGSVILEKAKSAIEVALMASGAYKVAQKAGGN